MNKGTTLKKAKTKIISGFRKFPNHLDIESTNFCNLACIMCPHSEMERTKGNMTFDTFQKIIDEAAFYGLDSMYLHILGEPLINPNIFKFVRYAKKFDSLKNVGFSTNCTLLNEERAKEILDSGLDKIILAVDGINKDTYEKIRLKSDFDFVKENVERFLVMRKKKRSDMEVQLSMINLRASRSELSEFSDYWRPFLIDDNELSLKEFSNFGGQVDSDLGLIKFGENRKQITFSRPCSTLWRSLAIMWNGDVSACCLDSKSVLMKLGNINETSISDIWLSELQHRYRTLHLKRDFDDTPLCKSCNKSKITINLP